MKWLISGGNGQLGRSLSDVLEQRGFEFLSLGVKDLDIRSAFSCSQQIQAFRAEVVVNTAAWTDVDGAESNPDAAYAVNTTGARNLAAASKAVGAIFAHVSTDYVFAGTAEKPWAENSLRAPISVYGITKAAGEEAVLSEYAERTYLLRTAWLYSPCGKNFAKTMTRLALKESKEVMVVTDQIGQPTSASDLASQIIDSILAKLPFGTYHATNSGQATWFQFAQEIFDFCGQPIERVIPVNSSAFSRPAKRPSYSVLSHDAWQSVGAEGISVSEMRDWRIALSSAMPSIISAVQEE